MSELLQHAFNGLVNGSFYALLALGLAVIFGMLGVVNFAHGAFYMLGAFGAFILLSEAGVNFWVALVVIPVALGLFGMGLEQLLIRRLVGLDPLYNFLLTFGLTLIFQDLLRMKYGVQPQQYPQPAGLGGTVDLGLFTFPSYQVFVLGFSVLVSVGAWFLLARTRVGMIVRASTERPEITRAMGINVGRWVSPVFGFGIGLAALSGVLAAPMRAVSPLMGGDLIILLFAVVVIGGLGSIFGSVAAGFLIGVLLWRPAGLFGREEAAV